MNELIWVNVSPRVDRSKVELAETAWHCGAQGKSFDTGIKSEHDSDDTSLIDPAILYPPPPEAEAGNSSEDGTLFHGFLDIENRDYYDDGRLREAGISAALYSSEPAGTAESDYDTPHSLDDDAGNASSAYPSAPLNPTQPQIGLPAVGVQQEHWPYPQPVRPADTLHQYYQDTRLVTRAGQQGRIRRRQRSSVNQNHPPGLLPPWLISSYRSASLTHHKPLTAAWAQHELDLLERTPRSEIDDAFRDQHFPDRTDLAVSAKWLELCRNRQHRQIILWKREAEAEAARPLPVRGPMSPTSPMGSTASTDQQSPPAAGNEPSGEKGSDREEESNEDAKDEDTCPDEVGMDDAPTAEDEL
ncbi:hypothetical protein CMQ_2096 [Grosmannia clavigera kw1407]|uniref:Uncharacterized protein n=1 Tax=Grosmannia clavigera (strain kw1407 / UAMH 11150) TaxID=655863 RepID=F0XJF6_GROCL|nr:uncharacterized protein CMQ_2096 [Grosmannia clavigera kw1407]EFX02047.1 hypothetical protein CMQ_2096 [Grosmannia clavigera kw1407]